MKTYTVTFKVDGMIYHKQITADTKDDAATIARTTFEVTNVVDPKVDYKEAYETIKTGTGRATK